MATSHGTHSSPHTGDGDLGLFAMESRSSSTSFDMPDSFRRPSQAELVSVPSYPTPTQSTFSTLDPAPTRTNVEGPTPPSRDPSGITTPHTPVVKGSSTSEKAPLPTAPAAPSLFSALSLQDELSAKDLLPSQVAPSSASSSSAASPSNGSHLLPATASVSSSSSTYRSAVDSPASDSASRTLPSPAVAPKSGTEPSQTQVISTPPPVPAKSGPTPSVSQQSIASTSTITQARRPTSRSLASGFSPGKQAVSVEQELEADPETSVQPSSAVIDTDAISRRSSRRSRRSGLPPLQDRLPVGGGGPSAPPRNASFRDASKRTSAGNGYGDLGVEALSASGTSPSSPSMTSFLDLDSPRTSESSNTNRRPVPSRRTSLQAPSPRTPTFSTDPLRPSLDTQASSAASPGSSAVRPTTGRANSHTKSPSTSKPASRPTSSGGKTTLSGFSTAKTEPASQPAAAKPASALNLDRESMQRWVLSVGCVNFDLELGPDLEFLYPPLGISREERDNIAFSSFPDTSIFDDGSLVFSWRVREVPLDSSGSEPPTIKTLNDALQQPSTLGNDETPRPSMNKAALQNAMQKNRAGQTTSPPLPPKSVFRDSSATSAHSHSLSKPSSSANLRNGGIDSAPASLPATTSFHERLTQKLFSSSGSSAMARHMSHDRHSSTHSMSSASASADDDGDVSTTGATTSSSATSTGSTIPENTNQSVPTSDLIHPKRAGGNSTSSSYIYGYVFFRQKPDSTNRRGYFQKSVVILSHLPLVGLFSEVVSRLGPLYFEHGMSMFEAFANDIMSWPAPQPGTILTLPLLGSIITAAIPFGQQPQNSPNAESAVTAASTTSAGGFMHNATASIRSRSRQSSANGVVNRELPEPLIGPEGPLLASIPSTSLFNTFQEALGDLWLLWECVLLAEPILVIAPEPKIASEAVWHMLDLIRPIPYAGDFRPYFHIHDYDFRTLVTKNKPQAGTLIASTNPFFATACSHWPHVLRVGKAAVKLIQIKHGSGGAGSGFAGAAGSKKPGSTAGGGGIGGGHGAGGGGPDHIPGFTTKRKRRISKDRQLLKRLQDLATTASKAGSSDAAIEAAITNANVIMRRYFADLTERFLAPLNRYVASLVPASFDLSSPSEVPKIRPFNTTDFLASLKAHGTPLAIRSRSLPTGAGVRQSLYLDFLRCPNFSLWLHARVAAAEEEQRRRYIASLLQGDVTAFGHSKGEIETIDLYSRLVEEIRWVDVQLTAPTAPGPGSRWRTDKPGVPPKKEVSESGRNTPTMGSTADAATTERRLREQKSRLMAQLEKLCRTLPDDLQSSLRRPQ